jgi:hypothetical protein
MIHAINAAFNEQIITGEQAVQVCKDTVTKLQQVEIDRRLGNHASSLLQHNFNDEGNFSIDAINHILMNNKPPYAETGYYLKYYEHEGAITKQTVSAAALRGTGPMAVLIQQNTRGFEHAVACVNNTYTHTWWLVDSELKKPYEMTDEKWDELHGNLDYPQVGEPSTGAAQHHQLEMGLHPVRPTRTNVQAIYQQHRCQPH